MCLLQGMVPRRGCYFWKTKLAIVEEELSPKQKHLIGLETLDLPQRKWSIQKILDAQVKVISYVQNELNSFMAKRDIMQNKIKTQHGKVQQLKDNLEDAIDGLGIMKEEIKKVECALSIVTCIFNIARLPGKDLQMVGQGSGILELTQGELEHVGQD